jgi:hypothetical protein
MWRIFFSGMLELKELRSPRQYDIERLSFFDHARKRRKVDLLTFCRSFVGCSINSTVGGGADYSVAAPSSYTAAVSAVWAMSRGEAERWNLFFGQLANV